MKKLNKIVSLFIVTVFVLSSFDGNAQDFDKIGIEHNKMLEQILPNLKNSNSKNAINDVTEELIKVYPKKESEIIKMFSNFSDSNIFVEPKLLLKKIKENSSLSNQLYLVAMNSLNKIENINTAKEISKFVNVERSKKYNLSKLDLEKYQNFLSILKHSSSFWETKDSNIQSKISRNTVKIALIDCVGAFIGVRGGLFGALIGGVGASLIAAIMTYW